MASPASIRSLILDMDGVLWRSFQPIGDLPRVFGAIQSRGWNLMLATNNATRAPEEYVEKLQDLGVAISPEQVINSGIVTAFYLEKHFPQGGPLYVVGEQGLINVLAAAGFFHTGAQKPLAVVVGLDRRFDYEKMNVASCWVREGVPFIGTNPDATFPTPQGLVPGAGAVIKAVETASGVQPSWMGKPSPEMYRVAMQQLGTTPQETLVAGDRLETDIAGGQALGCLTGLVLSGVTSSEQAACWKPQPDWIAADLTELLEKTSIK